jgi:biopolymer transport protein ExbD
MSFIPDEELQTKTHLNLTPMVDFLFLVVAVFATLAITRTALHDTEVDLAKLNSTKDSTLLEETNQKYQEFFVNVSVSKSGEYKWLSEMNEFTVAGVQGLQDEISKQQELGLLPKESSKIKVLLHIDKNAPWEPIAEAILGIKEIGLDIHPVYEPK